MTKKELLEALEDCSDEIEIFLVTKGRFTSGNWEEARLELVYPIQDDPQDYVLLEPGTKKRLV